MEQMNSEDLRKILLMVSKLFPCEDGCQNTFLLTGEDNELALFVAKDVDGERKFFPLIFKDEVISKESLEEGAKMIDEAIIKMKEVKNEEVSE